MKKILFICLLYILNTGLAHSHASMFAYITNALSAGHISICEINPLTGTFDACEHSFINQLATPLDIVIAPFADTTYAYISNNNYPAVITQCEVHQGQLQACLSTEIPSYTGIALHKSEQWHLYLSRSTSVQKCKIDTKGALHPNDCKDTGAGEIFVNGPVYIKFHQSYVYIANGDYRRNAAIIMCTVETNGDFNNCKDSGAGSHFDGAADIDFITLPEQTYAYITQSGGEISKCWVDAATGLLSHCIPTGSDFHSPLGMDTLQIADDFYVYVVDGGFRAPVANTVSICKVDLSGDLDCKDSGTGGIFSNPFGIALIK